jgi:hypothetical protein
MRRVIPKSFRTPRALRALNVIAVGCAIAAMTTAVAFSCDAAWRWSIVAGLPTLVVGTVWAVMLRMRETVGVRGVPVGWVLSVPLAALNGALACGLMFFWDQHDAGAFFGGAVLGATFGAIAWVPGLSTVLVLFGLPIAWAQRLARRGLAGEERGEILVGAACVTLGVLAVAIAHANALPPAHASAVVQAALFHAFAVVAVACGASATAVAARRELARRRFVARVERDEEPNLRVEPRASGKVLVRVEPWIESYRVAPPEDEELVELDCEGRAVRALR